MTVSWGVGRRRGLDSTLLWLWCRLVAMALIRPPAWESPYAVGAALEKAKRPKKKKKIYRTPLLQFKVQGKIRILVKDDTKQ